MKIGYFLSCEEYRPAQLIEQAVGAQEAGFDALWISDHFHPWNDAQGQSPFMWSVIGALSQACDLPVTTAVTCPIMRMHPAIVAQAAATSADMLSGRFTLGVGTGEALNEHILGDAWPSADVRLAMLEESVEVMRTLWEGGQVSHDGDHYTVENARIYALPDEPVEVIVSGFGPKAVSLAAAIGDGFASVAPEAEHVRRFRAEGGGDKICQAGAKVCWSPDEDEAVDTVHRLWPNEVLPGELAGGHAGLPLVLLVRLVDRHHVGDLEDALLDALQLVAGARDGEEQEGVDHPGHGDLGLADADGLDQDDLGAPGLDQPDRLARAAGDPAERRLARARADEGEGRAGEVLHEASHYCGAIAPPIGGPEYFVHYLQALRRKASPV